jgi:hypothetical protein
MTDERESGIDFEGLASDLEAADYPLTTEELLDQYGSRTVTYSDGEEQLDQLLAPLDDTYKSAEEVRQAIFNMVGEEAEGRENYTDRGTSVQNESHDQESF